jgi:hypothetical protein
MGLKGFKGGSGSTVKEMTKPVRLTGDSKVVMLHWPTT